MPCYKIPLWCRHNGVFYGGNCRMSSQKILLLVFLFAFIFSLPLIFTLLTALCLPLALLIFSPPWNFMFFFQRNSSPLFLIFFSVIHLSVDMKHKKITSGKTGLCCVSSLLKSWWQCDSPPKNLALHLGCHTCWVSYFTLVYLWWGRTGQRTVTWLSKFLGWISNRTSLPLWCFAARSSRA